MAGLPVSGATIGLSADVPSGLTSSSTNAEKVTAYGLLTYTAASNCKILQMPAFDEYWDLQEDEPTVCDNEDEILSKYKTNAKVSDSSLTAYFEKDDPIIVLFNTLRASRSDVGTIEFTHSNGTDKIWAQIEVSKTNEDPTDTTGKVKFMVEFFFKKRPVRN